MSNEDCCQLETSMYHDLTWWNIRIVKSFALSTMISHCQPNFKVSTILHQTANNPLSKGLADHVLILWLYSFHFNKHYKHKIFVWCLICISSRLIVWFKPKSIFRDFDRYIWTIFCTSIERKVFTILYCYFFKNDVSMNTEWITGRVQMIKYLYIPQTCTVYVVVAKPSWARKINQSDKSFFWALSFLSLFSVFFFIFINFRFVWQSGCWG